MKIRWHLMVLVAIALLPVLTFAGVMIVILGKQEKTAVERGLLEKFFQTDSSETRLCGGVGLGLYIVKTFTELLGGKVEVRSKRGEGSSFTVTIPVEMSAAIPAAAYP